MTIILEKSKEVEKLTQELTALQKNIQDQWNLVYLLWKDLGAGNAENAKEFCHL